MSGSLEDRLWDALEPAVARELDRSRVARAHASARTVLGGRWLGATAAIAAVAFAIAVSAALIAVLARPAPHPARPHPHNVNTVDVGTALGDAATGYDAVWTYDIGSTRLLRVDPAARHVVARVPFPNPYVDAALATGAGSVWAVPIHDSHLAAGTPDRPLALLRFDPGMENVAARIPIRVPGGDAIVPVGLEATDDAVWVWGQAAAVRIDPTTNRLTGAIRVPGATIKGFAIAGGSAWIATDGGRLLRYDTASGRRTGAARIRPLIHSTRLVVLPHAVIVDGEHGVTRAIDPRTGRLRWQASLPGGIESAVVAGSRIWILTTSATRPENVLVALDADTGRAVARIGLPTSGGVALAAVGPDLWVTDEDGDAHIVHP